MTKRFELPPIPESEQTPLVRGLRVIIEALVQEVQRQEEQIGRLEDEIAVLKGEKKRPRLRPSKLDEKAGEEDPKGDDAKPTKRPGSEKRAKTAEFTIHIALNKQHREDQQAIRAPIGDFYAELKRYRQAPAEAVKAKLEARFDAIFTTRTGYQTLNPRLKRLHRHKAEWLLVLERPDVPLHTNDAENDRRDRVKKRHISAGTRSDPGRRSWDTFASLKKTCRKLGVSFWTFIVDRVSGTHTLPPLPALIQARAASP